MMAKRIGVLLLALAAPLAHADTLPSLRDACRQSALQVEETAAAAFSACDPYHAAARPSAADSVLAGIYMARINDRLTRLDARQLGEGQALGDAQRHYSRPQRYLDESAVAAAGLESGQRWLVPELVALLTSNSGIGVHAAAAVFKQVQASPMAQGLDEGPQWAALELAAASFAELRRGAQGEQQRQQFLAHWPQVMHGLAQIDDGPLRALLELRATRQRAQLQQRDDPAAAFQSLLSAWQQAQAIPAELGFMQLLLANALEEHPALARSEMATVWSIVNDSPEAAFKARLVRSLSTVAEECTQIQALDVLAQQYADADGQDEASPVSGLMLRTLYGDLAGMRRELRGLQCLSPQRLRALDDGGLLSNLLQAAARQAGKDGELHRELAQLRTRMKAR